MTLNQLNESSLIYDDEVETYLNSDGSKKPWKHDRAVESEELIQARKDLEKELKKLDTQKRFHSKKSTPKKTKDSVFINKIEPLQAKVKNLRLLIKKLSQ